MSYFSKIPNTTYEFNNKLFTVKDISKRSRFISEYKPYSDLYTKYSINDSDTLESIALKYYGSARYHWVIALFNELHNINFEFPLSQLALDNYCAAKYGDNLYKIKHYLNADQIIVGEIRDYTEEYVNPEPPGVDVEAYTPVTFKDYEISLNDAKRDIYLLRPELLTEFATQFGRSFNG